MRRLIYVTHPQVTIDPAVPVPEWGLNEVGRERTLAACPLDWSRGVDRFVSSTENKAIETTRLLASARGLDFEIREGLHENDRSATGFLPPEVFEAVANEFFAQPTISIRGWERAVDAQARIVKAFRTICEEGSAANTLCLVGHGGVGTLLYCYLADLTIDRRHDQPAGGGNYFVFDITQHRMLHGWRAIDRTEDVS